jgi:hypothetical protein
MNWSCKRKGFSHIWTHPKLSKAVVDNRGFGINPRVYYMGKLFKNVEEAKLFAMSKEVSGD